MSIEEIDKSSLLQNNNQDIPESSSQCYQQLIEKWDEKTITPEMQDWFRQEVAIGAKEAEQGIFSSLTLAEIRTQIYPDDH
jgi:hypothetical protein